MRKKKRKTFGREKTCIHKPHFQDGREIVVFQRNASGDVAPIRKLGGPKTHISNIYGVAVDPVHNLIVVGNRVETGGRNSQDAILIFNRTDAGDVAPRAMISGPHTGIIKIRQVVVDEERSQIFAMLCVRGTGAHGFDPTEIFVR